LGLASEIFVPVYLDLSAVNNIKSEGANVVFVEGDYDQAVQEARNTAEKTEGAFWIQDTAFKDYESIPQVSVEDHLNTLI
jgi:threonine dehydratase